MDINNVKQVMKEKKITQLELSNLSGIPLQTLKCIFTGRTPNPRIDTVEAIEKALGLKSEQPQEVSPKVKELVDLLMQFDDKALEDALSVIKIIAKK